MKKYKFKKNEKLTNVRVNKVWLKEYFFSKGSIFKSRFPGLWLSINQECDAVDGKFTLELKNLKHFISTSQDLYIIFTTTEAKNFQNGLTIGQRAFLSNKESFLDITFLMFLTNLVGCKFQRIHPPYEDFVNEFIGEIYF